MMNRPSPAAAARAAAAVAATAPGETGTPCAAKRSRAWYSYRSTEPPSGRGEAEVQPRLSFILYAICEAGLVCFRFRGRRRGRPGPPAGDGGAADCPTLLPLGPVH